MRIFGDIDGVPIGTTFPDRRALLDAGVHRQLQAGIAGSAAEGADSIVVSGGYEDDDFGDLIIYTGQGGNDPVTKRQVADQRLSLGNAALAESCRKGLPVRVIRGRNPAVSTRRPTASAMRVSTTSTSIGEPRGSPAFPSGGSG
jgi:putative restriction endonuclease